MTQNPLGAAETVYRESASVYDALFREKDYAAAAAGLRGLIADVAPNASSLLDVGCGTGRYLAELRGQFDVEGLDLSPEMLAVARERCPGVPLHEGDLVEFRLGRSFDVVCCLFGSVGYARTPDRMRRAVATMARHLEPGGVLIVEPWVTPDQFIAGKVVHDVAGEPELAVSRMYVTRVEGRVSIFDSHYLVATPEGVAHFTERQELGLFTDAEYRDAVADAGLEPVEAAVDLFGYGLYVSRLKT